MAKQIANRRQSPVDYLTLVAPEPPSGRLINAILEYADVLQSLGSGQVVLGVSRERVKTSAVRRSLGRQAQRLNDLSLIWDEDDEQIVRVCDDADLHGYADESLDSLSDLDTFELTEAALEYVARFA